MSDTGRTMPYRELPSLLHMTREGRPLCEASAMRLPRIRFTVRGLMVAVAVVAVSQSLGYRIFHLAMWSYHLHRLGEISRDSARSLRTAALAGREIEGCVPRPPTPITANRRDEMLRIALEDDRRARQYEQAARSRWRPLPPDFPGHE